MSYYQNCVIKFWEPSSCYCIFAMYCSRSDDLVNDSMAVL